METEAGQEEMNEKDTALTHFFPCTETRTFRLHAEAGLQSGLITGVRGRDPDIMVFKGMPLAAPPGVDLRWQPPGSVES